MSTQSEYERLAHEILQDQQLRVTLFTFSVTTVAAILGVSLAFGTGPSLTASVLSMGVVAAYVAVIPCAVLISHFSRGINCKSEYLNVVHHERWMACYDRLTETAIPSDPKLMRTHRVLVALGVFSSENSFRVSYTLLNILIASFAVVISLQRRFGIAVVALYIGLFLFAQFVMRALRPISKKDYRELWLQIFGDENLTIPRSAASPEATAQSDAAHA